jgi:hypothetical protein
MKICSKCRESKSLDMFYAYSSGKDGRAADCKTCHNESVNKWRTKNKDKYNETNREYRASKREGRYVPQKKGARPKVVCLNGHDMAVTRRGRDGESYCSACRNMKAGDRKKSDPARFALYHRRSKIKKAYGITLIDFDALLEKQGGGCAICGKTEFNGRGAYVDHDHETGMVRGILCVNCNTGMGMFKDSIENMRNAIMYLDRHKRKEELQAVAQGQAAKGTK